MALPLLAVAMVASAALLIHETRQLTFAADDWDFLLNRRGLSAGALLDPHSSALALLPAVVYKALLAVFGMDSARPFQFVSIALFLTSAALLFLWLRGRVDAWLALGATVLILFLGAAWEDLLAVFGLQYFGSMAAGLGVLLALRAGRRADGLACVLLVVSVACASLGLAFVVGAAVALVVSGRWRVSAWVVAIPIVLYLLWWVGWGHTANYDLSLGNLASAPLHVIDSIGGALSSLLGLATPRDEAAVAPYDWGRPLAIAALAVAGWTIYRRGTVSPWLWVVGSTALTFWVVTAFNASSTFDPGASRYQYVGAILVILIAAELVLGVRLGPIGLAVTAAVVAFATMSNIAYLNEYSNSTEQRASVVRADLGALELAADTVDPSFTLTPDVARTGDVPVEVGAYLSAVADFGSPALDSAQIATAPDQARAAADSVLAAALGLTATPTAPPPTGGCQRADLGGGSAANVPLTSGGAIVVAYQGASAELGIRRFASPGTTISAGHIDSAAAVTIAIPADRSNASWQLEATGRGTISVCPVSDA